jgi:hypothetical protein
MRSFIYALLLATFITPAIAAQSPAPQWVPTLQNVVDFLMAQDQEGCWLNPEGLCSSTVTLEGASTLHIVRTVSVNGVKRTVTTVVDLKQLDSTLMDTPPSPEPGLPPIQIPALQGRKVVQVTNAYVPATSAAQASTTVMSDKLILSVAHPEIQLREMAALAFAIQTTQGMVWGQAARDYVRADSEYTLTNMVLALPMVGFHQIAEVSSTQNDANVFGPQFRGGTYMLETPAGDPRDKTTITSNFLTAEHITSITATSCAYEAVMGHTIMDPCVVMQGAGQQCDIKAKKCIDTTSGSFFFFENAERDAFVPLLRHLAQLQGAQLTVAASPAGGN